MISSEQLKKIFKTTMDKFVNSCIPLSSHENFIYFISESYQLHGFDQSKNVLFEPSSVNKLNLINDSMKTYFTDEIKKILEDSVKLKFGDLVELNLKINCREKYIGRKFFFHKNGKMIYIWSLVNGKWEKSDIDTLRHIFSNNEILTDPSIIKKSEKAKSLDELGIEFHDLEEIKLRFRDASIHYYHRKLNRIYSLNIASNIWYVPTDTIQKQLLSRVKEQNNDEKEDNVIMMASDPIQHPKTLNDATLHDLDKVSNEINNNNKNLLIK